MKNIFILAGSQEQFELIFEAKRLGFIVHLFDGNKYCEAFKYADFFYHIDIIDKAKILEKALNIRPDAVLTIATEVGNLTACYINEKLGLYSNSYLVSVNTTNKLKMKEVCIKNEIATARYKLINSSKNLDWDNFPAIIKPSDSSAGRGVFFLNSKKDFEKFYEKAYKYSRAKEVLVEEYISGLQYSIETISRRGQHKIVAITEEYISEPPKIIETQQLLPARIDEEKKKKIEDFAIKTLNAFEISFGAAHIEIKETNNGELFLIEIASRIGGWRSELINLALGISYCQLLIFSALDKSIDFKKSRENVAIVKLVLSQNDYEEYNFYLEEHSKNVISLLNIQEIKESKHLSDLNGFYFLHIQDKKELSIFIGEHK